MFEQYIKYHELFKTLHVGDLLRQLRTDILTKLQTEEGSYFSERLRTYFRPEMVSAEGVPFARFEHEPSKVVQIKHILNAFYHTEQASRDVEAINLRDIELLSPSGIRDVIALFKRTYQETATHLFQAVRTITHLDLDLIDVFGEEIKLVQGLANHINHSAATILPGFKTPQGMPYRAANQLGLGVGIALDQLHPNDGKPDYEFLRHLSNEIPKALDGLTKIMRETITNNRAFDEIQNLTAEDIASHLRVNEASIKALRDNAQAFIWAFEKRNFGKLINSLNSLRYIRIARRSYHLVMSILDQIGHLNESSQDIILNRLSQLKSQYLPELLGYADKLEAELMLAPGMLSDPLLKSVSALYKTIQTTLATFVDYSHHEGLKHLTDVTFLAKRQYVSGQRIVDLNRLQTIQQKNEAAADKFFAILRKDIYQNQSLIALPESTKAILINHYRRFQVQLAKLNPKLDVHIVNALTKLKTNSFPLPNWSRQTDLQSSEVLLRRIQLHTQFTCLAPSPSALEAFERFFDLLHEAFHLPLQNSFLIQKMCDLDEETKAQLQKEYALISPYLAKLDSRLDLSIRKSFQTMRGWSRYIPVQFNWRDNLKVEDVLMVQSDLCRVFAQEKTTHQFSSQLCKDVITHIPQQTYQTLCNDFLQILEPLEPETVLTQLSDETRAHLLGLLENLRPFLQDENSAQQAQRHLLMQALNGLNSVQTVAEAIEFLNRLNFRKTTVVGLNTDVLPEPPIVNDDEAPEPLMPIVEEYRAGYVLKHHHFSQSMARLHEKLASVKSYFSVAIQKELTFESNELPFPELEEYWLIQGGDDLPELERTLDRRELHVEETANTLLTLKRLHNAVYYLKQAAIEYEQLHDDGSELVYIYHFAMAKSHLYSVYELINDLSNDSTFAMIGHDLLAQFQESMTYAQQLLCPYVPDALAEENEDEAVETTRYEGLLYASNFLFVSPDYFKSFCGEDFSEEIQCQLRQQSEQIEANIRAIVDASDSYFRLLLKTPVMFKMFMATKNKVAELARVSKEVAVKKLEDIQQTLFAKILIETDHWEDNIGLKPGILSAPMRKILNEYFDGLIKPLVLDSKRYVRLKTNLDVLEKRLHSLALKKELLDRKKHEVNDKIERLMALENLMSQSKDEDLIAAFQNAHPILCEMQEKVPLTQPIASDEVSHQEAYLNRMSGSTTNIRHIETLLRFSLKHYRCQRDAVELNIANCLEKQSYLEDIKTRQQTQNVQFIDDYKQSIFTSYINKLQLFDFQFKHCQSEYKQNIVQQLEHQKSQFFASMDADDDIAQALKGKMLCDVDSYIRQHKNTYAHLDAILSAVADFNAYLDACSNSHLFESSETKALKKEHLRQIEHLARNQALPAQERINQIKVMIADRGFKQQMLQYRQHNALSFKWLKQCLVSLLEAITFGFYKPAHKKQVVGLDKSVKATPKTNYTNHHFGLFANPKRPYDLPRLSPNIENDAELPVPQAGA